MTRQDGKRPGIGALGPKWIAAIASLIVALTGAAGVFVGRVTAPAASGPMTDPQRELAPDPSVYYHASVTFDRFNPAQLVDLDRNPPIRVDGSDIRHEDSAEAKLQSDPGVFLAEWNGSDQLPTKQQCSDQVALRGVQLTGPLNKDSVVCVRTAQGRIARLDIKFTIYPEIQAFVVVWK